MVSPALTQEDEDKAPEPGRARRLRSWLSRLRERKSEPAPPLRLLFLDDDSTRAETFLGRNPQAVWVQTVCECLELLVETWDEVHLDHDLGGKTYVDVNDIDCGMEVIRWLCTEPREHLRTTRFFVHTHNSVAGLLMVLQMRSSGYRAEFRPFGFDLALILAHNEPDEADGYSFRASCSRIWRACLERLGISRPAVEPPGEEVEGEAGLVKDDCR
jgi:hypothetical protein